jgi:hypothetical protein
MSFMPPALNVSSLNPDGRRMESIQGAGGSALNLIDHSRSSGFALLVCYCTAVLIPQITRPGFQLMPVSNRPSLLATH